LQLEVSQDALAEWAFSESELPVASLPRIGIETNKKLRHYIREGSGSNVGLASASTTLTLLRGSGAASTCGCLVDGCSSANSTTLLNAASQLAAACMPTMMQALPGSPW